ncbi:hypothetical protein FCOIX_6087 [Fusarium coicis]|nr:hypothetical protein FCOIX_6087 [Fusarium coicis]
MANREIEYLVRHRVNREKSTVKFLVEWTDDTPRSWEAEEYLQRIDPKALYSYWDERGGRDQVTRLQEFHIYRVKSKGWKKGEWAYNSMILSDAPAAVADWEAREAARQAKVAARKAGNQ